MRIEQQLMWEFHEKFNVVRHNLPTISDRKTRDLRISLIEEEFKEFVEACEREDIVDMADALADLMYVVIGAAVSFGFDIHELFDEVHRSNMSKIWSDGLVHYREDGKVIKPTTYSPADIKKILEYRLGYSIEAKET